MKEILGFLGKLTFIFAPLIFLKYIFVYNIRLRKQYATTLLHSINNSNNRKKFVIFEEITDDPLPKNLKMFCWFNRMPLRFVIEERMLTAGFQGVDILVYVSGLRWHKKKILDTIKSNIKVNKDVPLYILHPWDAERIGQIRIPEKIEIPFWKKENYSDIEKEISDIMDGKKDKTGIILHGKPGNGKSFFIRYISMKFGLPIYIVSFTPELNNQDIIRTFSRIKGPAIVLFEDFDSYFDKRKCLMDGAKFTYDSLLNALDGVYCNPDGVIFFMTANDIEKIDPALRQRPSRFRFVRELGCPDHETIKEIFDCDDHEYLIGKSLDEILFERDKELDVGE